MSRPTQSTVNGGPNYTPNYGFSLTSATEIDQNFSTIDTLLSPATIEATAATAATAAVMASGIHTPIIVGVAVCTGSSPTITFAHPYTAVQAPIVVVTGIDGWDTKGLGFSVSVQGTSGNWTGFTLNLSGSFFGAFNWVAFGNPN